MNPGTEAKAGTTAHILRARSFTALALLTWAWTIVPRLLQSLLASKSKAKVGFDTVAYSTLAEDARKLLIYLLFALCLCIIAFSVRDLPRNSAVPLAVFLAPWCYLFIRDEYTGMHISTTTMVYPILGITIWILRPKIAQLEVLGYLVGLTALLSIVLAVALPSKGVYQSVDGLTIDADKEILPWGILIGPLTSGNNLGQFLVVGIPAAWLIRNRICRFIVIVSTIVALFWTASRSCLITLAVVAAVLLVMCATSPQWRGWVAGLSGLGMLSVVVALPVLTTDPEAFTNRGGIWGLSLEAWRQNEWIGLGANWYEKTGATSASLGPSVFHGHNEYVQALVTGGVLLALLMGLVLLLAIRASARLAIEESPFPALFIVAFLGACMMEVSFALVDRDFLTPVMVIPLACIVLAETNGSPAWGPAKTVSSSVSEGVNLPHTPVGNRASPVMSD